MRPSAKEWSFFLKSDGEVLAIILLNKITEATTSRVFIRLKIVDLYSPKVFEMGYLANVCDQVDSVLLAFKSSPSKVARRGFDPISEFENSALA